MEGLRPLADGIERFVHFVVDGDGRSHGDPVARIALDEALRASCSPLALRLNAGLRHVHGSLPCGPPRPAIHCRRVDILCYRASGSGHEGPPSQDMNVEHTHRQSGEAARNSAEEG